MAAHPRRYNVTLSKLRPTGHKDGVGSFNVYAFYSQNLKGDQRSRESRTYKMLAVLKEIGSGDVK
jgi:hypothetical protein